MSADFNDYPEGYDNEGWWDESYNAAGLEQPHTLDEAVVKANKEEDVVMLLTAAGMLGAVLGGVYLRRKLKGKE